MASKKVMLVLPPVRFDGHVFEVARRVLTERGHKVAVTSVAPVATAEKDGMSVPADVPITELKTYDYDAFVFLGGEASRIYFDDPRVRKLTDDVKWKTVGATGEASAILALSGVLKGKKATGDYRYAGLMAAQGAVFTNQPLEVHEKIITLQDQNAAEQFANAIAKAIE